MSKEGSFVKLHDGQYQFNTLYIIYAHFEAVFKLSRANKPNPEESYTKVVNQHIPSGFWRS